MAARYEDLRAVAAGLKECSNGVPFPGNLALQSASRLVLVMTAFMELKEVQERKRQLAERLLQRAVDISNLIERHKGQLHRDHACSSFILRFLDTIEVIHVFVSALMTPLSQSLWSKVTVGVGAAFGKPPDREAQAFEAHEHSLDSLHLDFQSYLLSSQASMGPHQIIKHPDVQVFWRCRLTNALEAPWEYFWDHFLDEYPQFKEIFSEEGQEMREIFQSLTRSRNKDVVDPMGLNRVFQPIDESVDRIVRAHLQSHLSSKSASKFLTLAIDPATQGEVQQWRGYWVQGSHKGSMELEIFVTYDHQVLGSGVDKVGKFTIEGEELVAHVNWTKHYVNRHIVSYEGRKVGQKRMEGSWSLSVDSVGNWSRGGFLLERAEDINKEDQASGARGNRDEANYWLHKWSCLNRLRSWTGFYEQLEQQYAMSTCLVFTPSGRIHGKGVDSIGHYTWCGTFCSGQYNGRKEVALIKQYFQAQAISYEGHIIEERGSNELVMTGTWTIADNCHGLFRLQSTRT